MKPASKGAGTTSTSRPLRMRIRQDIERRILSGDWPPGHRLPFEHELMEKYDCARMTVSKVLTSLADSGLIERKRRAGSFVRRPLNQSAVLEIPDIPAEVRHRGLRYELELLSQHSRRLAKGEMAEQGVTPNGRVLHLRCRHLADDIPFATEDRRIFLDAVPEAATVDFTREPPGSWMIRHVPWHEAEHQISACNADAEVAALLSLDEGVACLLLDRRTWRSGRLLTAVRVWYPASRQTLTARFTPAR